MSGTSITIIVIVLSLTAVRGFIAGWREETVRRRDGDSIEPASVDHDPRHIRTLERRGDGVWVDKTIGE